MKKLKLALYTTLIFFTATCVTSCTKDGGGGDGGGTAVLLGDLIGFWQNNTDSFTFQNTNGQLDGSGTIGGKTGKVANGVFNKSVVTFSLTFTDNSVKNYSGTIDATKKKLTLSSSGETATFTKQ
jgi:hypothetical protein